MTGKGGRTKPNWHTAIETGAPRNTETPSKKGIMGQPTQSNRGKKIKSIETYTNFWKQNCSGKYNIHAHK